MKPISPIGKKNFTGKKFKSVGPNQLSASDKNSIRNNINLLTKQQLAFKIGKPIDLIEKFIKREKLVSTLDVGDYNKLSAASKLIEVPTKEVKVVSLKKNKKKLRAKSVIVEKKIALIKENYQRKSAIELSEELGMSITTVRYHLKNLNLTPYKKERRIEKTETEKFIIENHKEYTVSELAEKLNCKLDTVRYFLRKSKLLALRVSKEKAITSETISFLRKNYRLMTAREMSNALGDISWTQVKYLCEKYGFLKTPEETTAIRNRWNRSEFTPKEEKYIIKNHGVITLAEIANNIKRTRSSVIQMLARKGLKMSKEQLSALNKRIYAKAKMKKEMEKKAAGE